MIPEPKPYPAYKDSGMKWLGKVPKGWEVKKLRQVTRLIVSNVDKKSSDSEVPVRLCNYVDVYNHEVITEDLFFMQATATKEEIRKFAVKRGDVAITKDSEIWNDIGVPAYVNCEAPNLIYGYHLAILRPLANALEGKYLFRTLQSQPVATQLHIEATGVTRFGLSQQAIKSVQIPLPPLPEQRAIVKFLDWADRRRRLIIAALKKRIQLLEEYRQTLINDAVTGKFDVRTGKPYPGYKDSGVEWLGKVPKHWEVRRLSSLAQSRIKNGVGEKARDYKEDWPRYIRITDIKNTFALHEHNKASLPPEIARQAIVKKGDLLFAAVGATYGKAYLYLGESEKACFAGYLVKWSPTNDVDPKWAAYWTFSETYWNQVHSGVIKATIENFSASRYRNLLFALPPLPEQRAIAEYLDRETRKIDAAIEKTKKSIELWEELRTALIADVVTGKLDVREVAEKLPEEEPELEAKIEALEASLKENGRMAEEEKPEAEPAEEPA